MLDFRRSDLLDQLYKRYLTSFDLTLETLDTTGQATYKFIIECYAKNLKLDVKSLETEMKYYSKFRIKERKHDIKIENINFEYMETEDYNALSYVERVKYCIKRRRFEKEMKKFARIVQKFRPYIPSEWFLSEEIEEETEEEKEVSGQAIDSDEAVQREEPSDNMLLASDNVAEETEDNSTEEVEDEQLQIDLDDFFGDVESDVNEEIEE